MDSNFFLFLDALEALAWLDGGGPVEALSPYYLGKWLGLDSSKFFGAHSSSYVGQLYSNIYIGVQQAIELDNSEKNIQ